MPTIHRTAVFALHNPTRHTRAALDRAFRDYTLAYTELLRACSRYSVDQLRGFSVYAMDERTGKPRMNARALSRRLFDARTSPELMRTYVGVSRALESRLRASIREQVAQTLLSYVKLHDAAVLASQSAGAGVATPGGAEADQSNADGMRAGGGDAQTRERASEANRREPDEGSEQIGMVGGGGGTVGPLGGGPGAAIVGMPKFPARLRSRDVTPRLQRALGDLAELADNLPRERELVAQLLSTRQAEVVYIPFVGVSPDYGCGLYRNQETGKYYARLDIVGSNWRAGRRITARGRYVDIKSGVVYAAQGEEHTAGDESFGSSRKSILCPLEMGIWHETGLPYARGVSYLPQAGKDRLNPVAATPMAAKLVRRPDRRRTGGYRYEMHVAFSMPVPERNDRMAMDDRPFLAIHRGIRNLYSAVVTTPDGRTALASALASGDRLRALQEAIERRRRAAQRQGEAASQSVHARAEPGRDRRQSRIAREHVSIAATQIVKLAQEHEAVIVFEDMSSFSPPNSLRKLTDRRGGDAGAAGGKGARGAPGAVRRAILNRRQFQRLQEIVAERLELTTLPPARVIRTWRGAYLCPRCGALQDVNALTASASPERFVCAQCGETQDRDIVAAANLARRMAWMRKRRDEKRDAVAPESRTPWEGFVTTVALNDLKTPPSPTN